MSPQSYSINGLRAVAALVLLSSVPLTAAERTLAPVTVRDRLWAWSHDASFDWPAHEAGALPARNRMTPVEGAVYLGVPNVMFIQYQGIPTPPFEQYYTPFKAMKQVYWTLTNNDNRTHEPGAETEHVYQLAAANPNITGLLLDDFLIGPMDVESDSHWLAANNPAFPVTLSMSLPQRILVDSVQLTQSAWIDGGYLTGKFAVDVSSDGTAWTKLVSGEMPHTPGAATTLSFPAQEVTDLRVRVLSSLDTHNPLSCGLKGLLLFNKSQPISLGGTQFTATSEFRGHEAARLTTFKAGEAGRAKVFTSQVSPRALAKEKQRMQAINGRKLDLAAVVYSHQLDEGIVPILKDVDVLLFWTWKSSDLKDLETNFRRLREILPGKRVMLGAYLWDFSNSQLMPRELMQKQSETGLAWLKAGEIEGMIFLGSNIMDKNLQTVQWTQEWISRVGNEELK